MQKFKALKEQRLDIFLSEILAQSRSQITQLIKTNGVLINEKLVFKAAFMLKNGDEITLLQEQSPQNSSNSQENLSKEDEKALLQMNIQILFEDEDLLVLNKPPNLVVHKAPSVKEPTLVDWLKLHHFHLSNLGLSQRAGLVHRLDKGTSGAILIAKNNATHQILSKQLQDKTMGRIYLALTDLPLKEDKIIVEKPLARSPYNRLKKLAFEAGMNLPKDAREAKSLFVNLLSNENGVNLIAAKLFTGRTHQIRAHLASLNRHILGDILYNYTGKTYERVMLHSYFLYFLHPKSANLIFVKAPIYDDFYTILKTHYQQGEIDEKTAYDYCKRLLS